MVLKENTVTKLYIYFHRPQNDPHSWKECLVQLKGWVMRILAINPGSTSTKIAVYEDSKELFKKSLEHTKADMAPFDKITDQFTMRMQAVIASLEEAEISVDSLSAVVGRGGFLTPVSSGAYYVDDEMIKFLKERPILEHAANLGAPIAYEIAKPLGIPAFIYDSVAVDEMTELAKVSGLSGVKRKSLSHALNKRATAIKCAHDMGLAYKEANFIVAHIGGGVTLSVHEKGRMVDLVSDDEGPFSPERTGRIPSKDLIAMCYQDLESVVRKRLRGEGGLYSYLGTKNTLEVQDMIEQGDAHARLVYEGMAYHISKAIGELAVVVNGKVDAVILTGGIAYSKIFTDWIVERVTFIAPVKIYPGENELESLALGVLRVLKGEEEGHQFVGPSN